MSVPLPSSVRRLPYYPYIDGLRALAVLAVLVFHLHGAWLPGGFVGVDVFFVISGFVVSASVAGYQGRNPFHFFAYFYARRIKRIFPALIVCLLVTAYFTALFIPGSWLSDVNQKVGLYAFFGFSNLVLAQTGRDYFAPTTEFNPYTHTWSLAVEEQFYLVFPLLFMAWFFGRRGRALSIALFAAGGVASLVYAHWQSQASPIEAYFLSPSRFWELAAGVLLFQITQQSTPVQRSGQWRGLLGFLSLLLLFGALVFSSPARFPFPGALPAVLGTLGVIFCLHRHDNLTRLHTVLGHPVLVAIGRMSYSLYLWHWAVFVLFRWTVGLDTFLLRAVAVLLTFALTYISYTFIENPVRHARALRRVPNIIMVILGAGFIGGGWWLAAKIAVNQPAISLSTVTQHHYDWYPDGPSTDPAHPGCVADPEYHNVEGTLQLVFKPHGCQPERPINPRTIYVIGDSHAMAYERMFKQYALRNSTVIVVYNNGGCPYVSLQPWREFENPVCPRFQEITLRDLRSRIKPGDVLFLPSLRLTRFSDQWTGSNETVADREMLGAKGYARRKRAVKVAANELKEFADRGVSIVFEGPKPIFKSPPFRCADWFNQNNPICAPGFDVSQETLNRFRQPVLRSLMDITQQLPHASLWDPFPVLCQENDCHAFKNGVPLFLDGDHLSGAGNLLLLKDFTEFLQPLMVSSNKGEGQNADER